MSEYLDAVQARIEGATKGPWETRINDLTDEVTVVHDSEAVLQVAWIDGDYRHTWAMPDAEFIAHARADVPRLLAAIRAVEAVHESIDALNVRFNRVQKVRTGCGQCHRVDGTHKLDCTARGGEQT